MAERKKRRTEVERFPEARAELENAFKEMDKLGSGELSEADFGAILKAFGGTDTLLEDVAKDKTLACNGNIRWSGFIDGTNSNWLPVLMKHWQETSDGNKVFVDKHKRVLDRVSSALGVTSWLLLIKSVADLLLKGEAIPVLDDIAFASISMYTKQQIELLVENHSMHKCAVTVLLETLDSVAACVACYCPILVFSLAWQILDFAAKQYHFEDLGAVVWAGILAVGLEPTFVGIFEYLGDSTIFKGAGTIVPLVLCGLTVKGKLDVWKWGGKAVLHRAGFHWY